MLKTGLTLLVLLWLLQFFPPALGAERPLTVKPEMVGVSSERLQRIDSLLQDWIDRKQIAGAVAAVVRRGKIVYFNSFGVKSLRGGEAMSTDTLFRIASMTKPITSTAAMMLYEEGRFLLDDPISKFIPEFTEPRVMVTLEKNDPPGKPYKLVPAKGKMTIRHLLTHTSGISYIFSGNEHQWELYKEAGVTDGMMPADLTLAENMKRLARQPLLFHPGEKFEYGLSTDVLGYLVEKVSGKPLNVFFRERIFEPLGMEDTYFYLPSEKVSRLAAPHRLNQAGVLEQVTEDVMTFGKGDFSVSFPYRGPRKYFSGGGGLVSSAGDYLTFCRMLLNGGVYEGVRILGRKTVELMSSNFIGHIRKDFAFGLGFGIVLDPARRGVLGTAGAYSWAGIYATHFFIDPKEELCAVLMTQMAPKLPFSSLNTLFRIAVYQSLL